MRAEADADLVELRLDSMLRPDPEAAMAGRRTPVIVTCRPLREGGMFDGAEEERLAILARAHALGADYIDVEWDADAAPLIRERRGRGIIVSRHDFTGTPPNSAALLDGLRGAGGEVAKLAVMTERLADLSTLLGLRTDGASVVIGMGRAGLATRILAGRFGSRWTYAGNAIAPGQLTAKRLLQEFRFRRIRPDSAVYALLGRPSAHSLSPAMHNAGFEALGLNAVYVPIEARDVEDFRAFAAAIGLNGASVTIPFKRDVMPLVDTLTPTAAAAGAVNTISIDGRSPGPAAGAWIGDNTDAGGFVEPLKRRLPDLSGIHAVVLGAGGAARAVGLALKKEGARVAISARRSDAARETAGGIGAEAIEWPPPRHSWDLLVNATPVGGRAAPGTPYDRALDGRVVYDLVYDPDPTELMRRAREAGRIVIGGLEMLVAQAERQFEIWTGQRPPDGLFAEAARAASRARCE
jgi:3-dehydroquinate dehydratase/shikimate dehydrogenase